MAGPDEVGTAAWRVHEVICRAPEACGYILGEEIHQHWDASTVALSLALAACGAFTSLTITSHLRHCRTRLWYAIFIVSAGLGVGVNTVWSMHFVGMSALTLRGGQLSGSQGLIHIAFEVGLTAASGAATWVIAAAGLHIIAGRSAERRRVVDCEMFVRLGMASALIALGVCVMHYMGMVSQTGPFAMELNAAIVFASAMVAAVASSAGLLILMFFPDSLRLRFTSACFISAAVNGMHYTGMASARYTVRAGTDVLLGSTAVEIHGLVVATLALMLDLVLYTVANNYGESQRQEALNHIQRQESLRQAKRDSALQHKVAVAVNSLEDFGHPMIVVPAPCFLSLSLADVATMHEGLRATGKLKIFDTRVEVLESQAAGDFIVFFSYECLSYRRAGPDQKQLDVMKNSVEQVAALYQKSLDSVYIWLDCLSIPQRNRASKLAAINSIYSFASLPDVMVIACPDSMHVDAGRRVDCESIKDRLWCRVEHLAFCCGNGLHAMHLHRGAELERLTSSWMEAVCCVYDSQSTCCRLRHSSSEVCDRETVVLPLLALYADVCSRRAMGAGAVEELVVHLIEEHRERMFPRTFTYSTPQGGSEVRELFGDMLERVDELLASSRLSVKSVSSRALVASAQLDTNETDAN